MRITAPTMLAAIAATALVSYTVASIRAEVADSGWTVLAYHLTARPWKPSQVSRSQYLDVIEGVCRFTARHQDASGAVIDPFLGREHQYATPYFAYAVGTLAQEGKALDLLPAGMKAMEHATGCFGRGRMAVPDEHGEFFIAALTGVLPLYEQHVPRAQWERWRERMKTPTQQVIKGVTNNWETYVMKGDWMRAQAGLLDRAGVAAFIESAWTSRHRARIAAPPFFLYHDRTSDPDTLSVEAVGRGNLLALTHLGYDGPNAGAIRTAAESATHTALLLHDPSGQVPANGRTDNHVWVEIGYQLAFEVMAERMLAAGDPFTAGQYRHAAMLAFQSAQRWRRSDGEWAGSFYVTKNHLDPTLRVGYQPASMYTNYGGSLMFHLAEAFHMRRSEIAEQPAPAEIGGYAFQLDPEFASAFANAGGMQIQVNLRGQVAETHANRWTPLGVVRFARPAWDTRLGPSDGVVTGQGGISVGPTFLENGRWLRLADLSSRYEGTWSSEFVHPLLVRCSVTYAPKQGQTGPVFRNRFVVTPDGVLSSVEKVSGGEMQWGVTWPLLENDGRVLRQTLTAHSAAVAYPGEGDEQNFLTLHENASLLREDSTIRGSYGDLRAIRVTVPGTRNVTFVYPRSGTDPAAGDVRASFVLSQDGFRSKLATVRGNLYTGRTSAGGVGDEIDWTGDGKPDATFGASCGFLIQLRDGKAVAVEADHDVTAHVQGRLLVLKKHRPATL